MRKLKLNIQLFASGSFEFTGGSSWKTITGKIEWSESNSSIEGNTSVVTTKLYAKTGTGGTTGKGWGGNVNVGGNNHKFTSLGSSTTIGSSYVLLKTYTDTITHNDDGTKTLTISGSVSGPSGTSLSGVTASGSRSVTLDTIPRASEPSLSSSSIDLGSSVTIPTNRVSTSFTHTIRYWFGNANETIATNVADSVSWTPSIDLATQIPSATSGIGSIYCDTYNGSTFIGTKEVRITLNVPSNIKPSVTFSSVSEAGDVPSSWEIYVKTKSRVALSLSASGVYGSSISSYNISYYGGAVAANSSTTSYLTTAGSTTFTGQVTDTRGRTNSTTTTINVVDYYNPTISTAQVQRCDINGNIDNNGEYMYISYDASISSCSNKNTPSAVYKVSYRVKDTGSYTEIQLASNVNSYSASGMLFTDGIKATSSSGTKVQFSSSNTYDIQFYVKDYFMEYTNLQSLDTGFDLMNFNPSGKAMAIGKVSEASANEELFEVGMNTEIEGSLAVNELTRTKSLEIGGVGLTTPFIDFHYNNDYSVDYTTRIIESVRGRLDFSGDVFISGNNSNGGNIAKAQVVQTNFDTLGDNYAPGFYTLSSTDGPVGATWYYVMQNALGTDNVQWRYQEAIQIWTRPISKYVRLKIEGQWTDWQQVW